MSSFKTQLGIYFNDLVDLDSESDRRTFIRINKLEEKLNMEADAILEQVK